MYTPTYLPLQYRNYRTAAQAPPSCMLSFISRTIRRAKLQSMISTSTKSAFEPSLVGLASILVRKTKTKDEFALAELTQPLRQMKFWTAWSGTNRTRYTLANSRRFRFEVKKKYIVGGEITNSASLDH